MRLGHSLNRSCDFPQYGGCRGSFLGGSISHPERDLRNSVEGQEGPRGPGAKSFKAIFCMSGRPTAP